VGKKWVSNLQIFASLHRGRRLSLHATTGAFTANRLSSTAHLSTGLQIGNAFTITEINSCMFPATSAPRP
jgi:hypothetical protein